MSKIIWPEALKNNSTAQALDCSFEQNRLGHGLLFVSDDFLVADEAAEAVALALLTSLAPVGASITRPIGLADYMQAQPMNKQRQIGVDTMRELREFMQKGSLSGIKVAHISQADRLHPAAANLFLKILEEPPADSYIIMTTSEPYAVLPTLVSRSMRFRFPPGQTQVRAALDEWESALREFLSTRESTGILENYALIDEAFGLLAKQESAKFEVPEGTVKEVEEAMEVSRQKAYRKEIFSALESAVLEAYKIRPKEGFYLGNALQKVERAYRMLDFNLNTAAAMESAVGGAISSLLPRS